MIKIPYVAKAFPKSIYGSLLQGNKSLSIDWYDLIWAAITVGKKNKSQISKHGIYSIYEIINRSTLVWTSLKSDSSDLVKTDIYKDMDPTEKAFISFSLGMMVSKLFSDKLLNVPWLEHISNFSGTLKTYGKTKSRPDLIGLNNRGEYVIVEAKGRTNEFDSIAQLKAKSQSKVIASVGGNKPILRVASQSYFKNCLKVHFEDPEGIDEESIDLEISEDDFFRTYYGRFSSLTENDLSLLKPLGIQLSFTKELAECFKLDNYSKLIVKEKNGSEDDTDSADAADTGYIDNTGFKVFSDGLMIKLKPEIWGESNMNLEPKVR